MVNKLFGGVHHWATRGPHLYLCTLAASFLLVGGVNCLAAGLALLGLCSYVLLYTAFLKPRTPQNIVFGGVAGAIPPLVGAAAARLGRAEGMEAHARTGDIRLKKYGHTT